MRRRSTLLSFLDCTSPAHSRYNPNDIDTTLMTFDTTLMTYRPQFPRHIVQTRCQWGTWHLPARKRRDLYYEHGTERIAIGGYLLHSGSAWTSAIGSAKRSLRIQDLAAT